MAESLREGKFSGIPVLFVPGNSGSHKQVKFVSSNNVIEMMIDLTFPMVSEYSNVTYVSFLGPFVRVSCS